MPSPFKSVPSILLVAVAAVLLLPTQGAAGNGSIAATDKLRAAETRLLRDVNRIRMRSGREPLSGDTRIERVARARSSNMAAKRYFGHVEPDGDDARRIIRRHDIPATRVTENIGHTYGLTLKTGSKRMAKWWFRSPPHRRQMLARDSDHVGIGIARRGSRFTYTAIFTRSRDETAPQVAVEEATLSDDSRPATVFWNGMDPRLATGAARISRFDPEPVTPLVDRTPVVTGIAIPSDSCGVPSPLGGDPSAGERSPLACLMQLARSPRRLGESIVGVYLIEEAGSVKIIDAVVPADLDALQGIGHRLCLEPFGCVIGAGTSGPSMIRRQLPVPRSP